MRPSLSLHSLIHPPELSSQPYNPNPRKEQSCEFRKHHHKRQPLTIHDLLSFYAIHLDCQLVAIIFNKRIQHFLPMYSPNSQIVALHG